MDCRVLLYHKHPTSARVRYLKYEHGSVLAFEPLPKLAQLLDEAPADFVVQPAPVLKQVMEQFGFASGDLELETEFQYFVDTPGGPVPVLLARITSMDPPFDLAKRIHGSFIDLMQARGMTPVELQLLRHAYELVLGGR